MTSDLLHPPGPVNAFLVDSASVDLRFVAEHRRDPSGERLGAVNDEQDTLADVEAPVGEIGE